MVNALFSSKKDGMKHFNRGECIEFGWKAIIDIFEHESGRVRDGHTRMIAKLCEAHIIQDSCIKLNVSPAKIMQVN